MADIMSKVARSERMSRIRSKDTSPEVLVRKKLWREGFRYRLHVAGLPGRPDLVFPKLRTVVMVHGCYWHGHSCQKGRIPQTNSSFWADKFAANKERDRRNKARLESLGWRVLIVWECSLSTAAKRDEAFADLVLALRQPHSQNAG